MAKTTKTAPAEEPVRIKLSGDMQTSGRDVAALSGDMAGMTEVLSGDVKEKARG